MGKSSHGGGNGAKQVSKEAANQERSSPSAPLGGVVVAVSVLIAAVIAAVALWPTSGGDRPPASVSPLSSSPIPAPHAPVPSEVQNSEPVVSASVTDPPPAPVSSSGLEWNPKTLSVVLPCAGEGQFAKKTIESVAASVPGGINGSTLKDIVVVDDGSKPPLAQEVLTEEFRAKYPITLVRHEKAIGLMGAKSAGAAVAQGDIIVFFDCHVAPQGKWYQEFLKASAENYRRIVVPVITDLNIDTWTERHRSSSMAKCYLTWDGDFKWVTTDTPEMPILSGGLLGISRRWWNETGGYDSAMRGWGGENIDQSLRTWLCGGEIVSLPKAFVAHMWRVPSDPRTNTKYEVSSMDALKNKARAVMGWFDEYTDKAGEFPMLNFLGVGSKRMKLNFGMGKPQLNTDLSNFHAVRDRLQCKPFAWFLWRFRHIYQDGGMLPPETFQLKELASGQCLSLFGPSGVHPQGRAQAGLMPCNKSLGNPGQFHPQAQRWHPRNKRARTSTCCSAIGSWNSDQCITMLGRDGVLHTGVCDVAGVQVPEWTITELVPEAERRGVPAGHITFQGKCLVADKKGGKNPLGQGIEGTPLKFVRCKEDAKARWRLVARERPLETELYEKALHDRPELFRL